MTAGAVARVALYLLLAVSLLGNAVALGLWLRLRDAGGVDGAWRRLPPETRAEFRAAVADRGSELRARFRALASARAEMLAAAEARPYDRAAVEAAMARVSAATLALQDEAQGLLLRGLDAAAQE